MSALWKQEGPHVSLTVCDLDWRPYQHPDIDLTERVRLWREASGALAAIAWFTPPDEIETGIDPRYREMSLFGQVLEWGMDRSRAIGSGNAPSVWSVESDVAIPYLLARLGFTPSSHRYAHLFRSTGLADQAEHDLTAPGSAYAIRTTRPEEIVARVEVHQRAFAPSRITVDSYHRLTECSGYERDLDIVAVAPDGALAAFAIGWLDQENRVGVIEPMGTHPDHRRRGLAKRVTREIMDRLRVRGANAFLLYTRAGSPAQRVYEPLGFQAITTSIRFDPPIS